MTKRKVISFVSLVLTVLSILIYLFFGIVNSNGEIEPSGMTGLEFIFGFRTEPISLDHPVPTYTRLGFSWILFIIIIFLVFSIILEGTSFNDKSLPFQIVINTGLKFIALTLMVLTILLANYTLEFDSPFHFLKMNLKHLKFGFFGFLSMSLLIGSIAIEVFQIKQVYIDKEKSTL